MPDSYGLHWFRRDLRVNGNPALLWNCRRHQGRVLGIFFFDRTFLSRPDFSHSRFAFFLDTLHPLREELQERGGDLLTLDAPPLDGFLSLIPRLDQSAWRKPSLLTFNRDYEPFARTRDAKVCELLERKLGVPVHTERDHLLIEPTELGKSDASRGPFQIYTPFAKKWYALMRQSEFQQRLKNAWETPPPFRMRWRDLWSEKSGVPSGLSDQLERFRIENARHVSIPIPRAGADEVSRKIGEFRSKIDSYHELRDFPAAEGTSRLSVFIKNGSLTTAQILSALELGHERFETQSGRNQFLKELVWREFYYHVLWHWPRVEKEAFLENYRAIRWENREDLFEAWKEGRTGYPMVDAGMRELRHTGWMHNRVRMVTASFLTKDLLIDWKWGERYFMEKLLDGDLAPNNGGWQWAASTGCDPQPYFRIFNPTLQSQKFDPDGVYLKRWLPERAHLRGKELHAPIQPIVDHASRKLKALAAYSSRKQHSA